MKITWKLLLVSLLFVQFSFAQDNLFSIHGHVYNSSNGEPIANHIVTSEVISGGMITTLDMETNAWGVYGDTLAYSGIAEVSLQTYDCLGNLHEYNTTVFQDSTDYVYHDFYIYCDTLNSECTAGFDYDSSPAGGTTIYFTNTSTGNPTGWTWHFGDGSISLDWQPEHQYETSGIYPVCLYIWNEDSTCYDIYCQDVVAGTDSSGCDNYFWYETWNQTDYTFMGESSPLPADYYHWDFGDGTTGSGQTVDHSYALDTSMLVVVSLTTYVYDPATGDTCLATSSQDVWVGNNSNDCSNWFSYSSTDGYTFDFTGDGTPMVLDYIWDFGDGSSAYGQDIQHTFSADGEYIVTLTTIHGDWGADTCVSASSQLIVVGDSLSDCENYFWYETEDNLTFSFYGEAIPSPAEYYYWDFGDNTIANGQNVTHTFSPGPDSLVQVCLTTWSLSPAGDSCLAQSCQFILIGGAASESIYGTIYTDGEPADAALVGLFGADPDDVYYEFVLIDPSTGSYLFENVPLGDYYLFTSLTPQSTQFFDYFPTYFGDEIFWFNADLLSVGITPNPIDIHMTPLSGIDSGPASIEGSVDLQDGKQALSDDIILLLMNEYNDPIFFTHTDETGHFIFDNLAYGTYKLKVEMPGVNSEVASLVLHENSQDAVIQFFIHNNNAYLGVDEAISQLTSMSDVFPNPVGSKARIKLETKTPTELTCKLLDPTGRVVSDRQYNLSTGIHVMEFETADLQPGVYYIQVLNPAGQSLTRKLIK